MSFDEVKTEAAVTTATEAQPPPQQPPADAAGTTNNDTNNNTDDDINNNNNNNNIECTMNLPPGRMHAVKGHHRLQGSSGNLTPNTSAPGTPRSRSRSPSLQGRANDGGTKLTSTTMDANSSISSLDEIIIDNDILTDRAGIVNDLNESCKRFHNSRENLHLPATVNERMTEDTLEDIHAFSDAPRGMSMSSNASRVSIVSSSHGGDFGLEPLDEEDSDADGSLDNDDDITSNPEAGGAGVDGAYTTNLHTHSEDDEDDNNEHTTTTTNARVILTNMENLTIEAEHNDPNNIENSLVGEAPSGPTL